MSCAPTIDFSGLKIWAVGDSITHGVGDGVSAAGGCGWRGILYNDLVAKGQTPTFIGTLTGGVNVLTCPENSLALAHDGHDGFQCPGLQAGMPGWLASIGGKFNVLVLEAGTNDLIFDQAHGTTLAQGNFDALLAASIALEPGAYFFVSNLPPSPNLNTAPLGQAFAAHVAAQVATYAAGGTKIYLIDHFHGVPDQGSQLTLTQTVGNQGQDFNDGGVHPSGPEGANLGPFIYRGYPKMAEITYLTMTHAAP